MRNGVIRGTDEVFRLKTPLHHSGDSFIRIKSAARTYSSRELPTHRNVFHSTNQYSRVRTTVDEFSLYLTRVVCGSTVRGDSSDRSQRDCKITRKCELSIVYNSGSYCSAVSANCQVFFKGAYSCFPNSARYNASNAELDGFWSQSAFSCLSRRARR